VPLSNFVPRGSGFVHHSIAILYNEVPNLNITIRNFFIAVRRRRRRGTWAWARSRTPRKVKKKVIKGGWCRWRWACLLLA
jgi:hypothetical protein